MCRFVWEIGSLGDLGEWEFCERERSSVKSVEFELVVSCKSPDRPVTVNVTSCAPHGESESAGLTAYRFVNCHMVI